MADEKNKEENQKDEVIANLERMLENMPENSKRPILDLIKKRKVELGLMESDLPIAGYGSKKTRTKARQVPKERIESLEKIAKGIGKVKETEEAAVQNIDVKEEPLRKDRKLLEETDSYKY